MSLEERKAFPARHHAERTSTQEGMEELGVKRQKHGDAEIKARNLAKDSAFDEAIRHQAGRKGLSSEARRGDGPHLALARPFPQSSYSGDRTNPAYSSAWVRSPISCFRSDSTRSSHFTVSAYFFSFREMLTRVQ